MSCYVLLLTTYNISNCQPILFACCCHPNWLGPYIFLMPLHKHMICDVEWGGNSQLTLDPVWCLVLCPAKSVTTRRCWYRTRNPNRYLISWANSRLAKAKLAKAVVLTRPITNYMDHLSLLETVRIRTRLRIQNILPQTSKCTMSPEEFGQNATRVLTGEAGMDVLHEYFNILQLPGDLAWSSFFGLNQDECLPITVMGMADSWRRLVLPFQGMPWALFRLIHMDFDQGIEFLRDTGLRTGGCAKCQDPFFGQVSCCQVACHTFFSFAR